VIDDASLLTTRQHERTQFVRCNTFGHAWFDYDTSDWIPKFGKPLVLRCERCGSERRDSIGASGNVIARHYLHPEGYKYAKGTRPSRPEFRRMMFALKLQEQRAARPARRRRKKAS
jgi:hypothetical protein